MINNLQFLRAVAAFLVVYVHIRHYIADVYPQFPLLQIGNAGVDIFFVLSGFVMVASTARRPVTSTDFYINRFSRVAPLYWLMTLIIVAAFWAGFHPVGVEKVTAAYVIQSMLFLPISRDGFEYPLLFVGWTLAYEMFFYVLFGVSLKIASIRLRLGTVTILLCGLVGLRLIVGVNGSLFLKFYTNPIMLDFIFGMWCGYAHSVVKWAPGNRTVWIILLVTAVCLIALPDLLKTEYYLGDFARPVTWGLAGAILVMAFVGMEKHGVVVHSKLLILMGAASYSIYLTHTFVLHAIEKIAIHFQEYRILFVLLMVGGGIPLTCLISVMLLQRFELPANRYVRSALSDFAHSMRRFASGPSSRGT